YIRALCVSSLVLPPPPRSTLFPYTTLFRSAGRLFRAALAPGKGLGGVALGQGELTSLRPALSGTATHEEECALAGSRVEDHPSYQKLLEIMGTLEDLGGASALLNWDQSVNMPQAAAAERARQRATLARFIHEMATSDQVLGLLQELASQVDLDSLEDAPSMIRVALRDVEKRRK